MHWFVTSMNITSKAEYNIFEKLFVYWILYAYICKNSTLCWISTYMFSLVGICTIHDLQRHFKLFHKCRTSMFHSSKLGLNCIHDLDIIHNNTWQNFTRQKATCFILELKISIKEHFFFKIFDIQRAFLISIPIVVGQFLIGDSLFSEWYVFHFSNSHIFQQISYLIVN